MNGVNGSYSYSIYDSANVSSVAALAIGLVTVISCVVLPKLLFNQQVAPTPLREREVVHTPSEPDDFDLDELPIESDLGMRCRADHSFILVLDPKIGIDFRMEKEGFDVDGFFEHLNQIPAIASHPLKKQIQLQLIGKITRSLSSPQIPLEYSKHALAIIEKVSRDFSCEDLDPNFFKEIKLDFTYFYNIYVLQIYGYGIDALNLLIDLNRRFDLPLKLGMSLLSRFSEHQKKGDVQKAEDDWDEFVKILSSFINGEKQELLWMSLFYGQTEIIDINSPNELPRYHEEVVTKFWNQTTSENQRLVKEFFEKCREHFIKKHPVTNSA